MLLAGTYERFLFGFKVAPGSHQDGQQQLVKSCTYAAHQNAVKCVAAGGYLVASGGADDQIHLYDVKHGKDLGFLMNPGDGAVPCIQFYCPPSAGGAPSHMLSGSADGSIAVWRAGGGWEHLKLMKGHKGSVNSLTIHPSGRLALSVAHDCSLRMWDMAKGRSHYTTQLDLEGESISFTPSGDSYVLLSGTKVTVHSAAGEGRLMAKLEHTRRVCSLAQLGEAVLVAGLEDGSIKVWDTRASTMQHCQDRAHATRIRGLACIGIGPDTSPHQLTSAATDGIIKLWDIRAWSSSTASSSGQASACMAEVATRARITCLAVADPKAPGPKPPPQPPEAKEPPPSSLAPVVAVQQMQAGRAAGRNGAVAKQPAARQKQRDKPEAHRVFPGFEVVSEQQQANKKRQHDLNSSDDDEGQNEPRAGHVALAKLGQGRGLGRQRQGHKQT